MTRHVGINESDIDQRWREIDLGRGIVTLVDHDDFEFVNSCAWTATSSMNSVRYAHARIKGRIYLLHRLIARARPTEVVDHINRNGLDNRKANLRLCTVYENSANRRQKPNRNGYRGISKSNRGKFYAVVRSAGSLRYGPHRETAIEAGRDYDVIAREMHGRFATLNFPENEGGRVLKQIDPSTLSSPGGQ